MNIETQILLNLIHNTQYAKRVIPYLNDQYFTDKPNQEVFKLIEQYVAKYATFPPTAALTIEADKQTYDQDTADSVQQVIDSLEAPVAVSEQWLVDQTEEYCKERALHLALHDSITIMNDPKRANGEISAVLDKALGLSFDNHIGHSLFDDAETRFDNRKKKSAKVPLLNQTLNAASQGGVEAATLNMVMAGCVHPDTTHIVIRYSYKDVERIEEVTVRKMTNIFDELQTKIEIFTPKGWERIIEWVDKGFYQNYYVAVEDLTRGTLECNGDHLLLGTFGWETVETLHRLCERSSTGTVQINTVEGFKEANVNLLDEMIPIYDIIIDCDHHSYFSNSIISHNTNVGKTLIMCHLAADDIRMGRNVLYITMEMSEEKITQRIEANLLDVSLDDFERMPKDWFLKTLDGIQKRHGGNFKVKEYPAQTASTNNFKHLLQELKLKQGFIPHVVYIDYLNLATSAIYKPGAIQNDKYIASIATEIRSLSQLLKIPIWSATQVNRGGFASSDPGLGDISESFALTFIVDWFLTVVHPPELEELGQYLFKQDKSRYSDKSAMRQFIIGVDKGKQRLYDLADQPYLNGNETEAKPPVSEPINEFFG